MQKTCRICNQTKEESEFEKNRKVCKKCRNKQILLSIHSNPKTIQKRKDWNKKQSKEYHRERGRKYREKHKEKVSEYQRNYKRKKLKNNAWYKIKSYLSDRIRKVVKNQNSFKSNNTLKLTGCSIKFLLEHLQRTAIKNGYLNFDINNYSGQNYHIDHIIPCSSFDLTNEKEQKKCFHWSNLQILTANENMVKGDYCIT